MSNRSRSLAIIMGLVAVLVALPAAAAPTCQNLNGETVKCGTSGAMPVGWRLTAEQTRDLNRRDQDVSEIFKWLRAFCAVGVLFAVLAAMPDFDGTHPGEWDREEDDP